MRAIGVDDALEASTRARQRGHVVRVALCDKGLPVRVQDYAVGLALGLQLVDEVVNHDLEQNARHRVALRDPLEQAERI